MWFGNDFLTLPNDFTGIGLFLGSIFLPQIRSHFGKKYRKVFNDVLQKCNFAFRATIEQKFFEKNE